MTKEELIYLGALKFYIEPTYLNKDLCMDSAILKAIDLYQKVKESEYLRHI